MSKTDDTEFRQFYQEIYKRTKNMEEHGENDNPIVEAAFVVHDGKGSEFIYRVALDGYLHGVVIAKINLKRYKSYVKKYGRSSNHGRTPANTIRRVGRARANLGSNGSGVSRSQRTNGNFGSSGVVSSSPQSNIAGNARGGQSLNQALSITTGANSVITKPKLPVGEDMSPRAVLANALEEAAQTDTERQKLQEYKDAIDSLNELEEHLHEVKGQIKEMSFAKGPRDRQKLADLRGDATRTENRINLMDKLLLRLEAAKPLQDVLDREKQKITKREKQRGREALQRYREKTTETREKRHAVEKLQKLVIDTSEWLSHPARTDVKCPDILKQPYANFLQNIDLSSQRLASGGDPTQKDLRLANSMSSLAMIISFYFGTQHEKSANI